jgi:hypothetical protein
MILIFPISFLLELIGLEPTPLVAGILPAPAGRLHSLTATSLLPIPPYSVGARFVSRLNHR